MIDTEYELDLAWKIILANMAGRIVCVGGTRHGEVCDWRGPQMVVADLPVGTAQTYTDGIRLPFKLNIPRTRYSLRRLAIGHMIVKVYVEDGEDDDLWMYLVECEASRIARDCQDYLGITGPKKG